MSFITVGYRISELLFNVSEGVSLFDKLLEQVSKGACFRWFLRSFVVLICPVSSDAFEWTCVAEAMSGIGFKRLKKKTTEVTDLP
jgi:hypothetical protein